MKRIALCVALVLCAASAALPRAAEAVRSGDAPEKELATAIVTAAVYGGQAQIVRRGEVTLAPGRVKLLCRDLPSAFLESSLIVEGAGTAKARIVGIDLVRQDSSVRRTERIAELSRELARLENERRDLQEDRDAVAKRRDLLQSIVESYSADRTKTEFVRQAFSISDWGSLLDYYQSDRARMGKELNALERKLEALETRIAWTVAEMERTNADDPSSRAVAIDCEVESAGSLAIDLSYLVPGASWVPEYAIRFDEPTGLIEIAYDARIRQATGEDWKGVSALLSTAAPQIGAAPPDLLPLVAGFFEQSSAIAGRVIDARSGKPLAFANVAIVGTQLGALTGADGAYRIENVPVGAYEVKAMMMGYRPSTRRGVLVAAGRVVNAGFTLEESAIGRTQEIVASAAALKSGVVKTGDELHVRGGRPRELQTQLSELSMGDALGGGVTASDVRQRVSASGEEIGSSVEALPLSYEEAAVASSDFTANLQIKTPLDLESGAEPKRALVVRDRLAGAVTRHAAPSVSEHVFLEGSFRNSLAVPLLPGVAEVYVESTPAGASNRVSTFVGREAIDGVAPDQAFTVHLGVDQSVAVSHTLDRKEYLTKSGGKTSKIRYRYIIALESFRKDSCEVRIEDRVPVSASAEIKISDVEIAPPPAEQKENGLVTWKVALPPGAKRTLAIAYTIAFPGGRSEREIMMSE